MPRLSRTVSAGRSSEDRTFNSEQQQACSANRVFSLAPGTRKITQADKFGFPSDDPLAGALVVASEETFSLSVC